MKEKTDIPMDSSSQLSRYRGRVLQGLDIENLSTGNIITIIAATVGLILIGVIAVVVGKLIRKHI